MGDHGRFLEWRARSHHDHGGDGFAPIGIRQAYDGGSGDALDAVDFSLDLAAGGVRSLGVKALRAGGAETRPFG